MVEIDIRSGARQLIRGSDHEPEPRSVRMRITEVDDKGDHQTINLQLGFTPEEAKKYAMELMDAAIEAEAEAAANAD